MTEFKPQTKGNWGVLDTLATKGPRIHMPVAGQTYELKSNAFTEMPASHAAKFLSDPSFLVVDETGTRQNSLPRSQSAQAGQAPGLRLGPGETIASLDELTAQALLARAVRLPGGEKFTAKTKRDTLQRFLLDAQTSGTARASGGSAAPEEPAGDLIADDEDEEAAGAEMAAKMLGDGGGVQSEEVTFGD